MPNPLQRKRQKLPDASDEWEKLGKSKQNPTLAPASRFGISKHETAQKSLVISQEEIKGMLHAESSMEKNPTVSTIKRQETA